MAVSIGLGMLEKMAVVGIFRIHSIPPYFECFNLVCTTE
ncbi:hypothetical protein [Methylomonas fluvii]|nr:hypothetical protein [Methylomonas fluvii]